MDNESLAYAAPVLFTTRELTTGTAFGNVVCGMAGDASWCGPARKPAGRPAPGVLASAGMACELREAAMRLRQICLVAESLAPAVEDLCAVLGLGVCHRDTGVAKWGLENAVMPVGGNFLEVVAPTRPDTSAGRYLTRRRGDGGYMVILQCADAVAERARITDLGVRAVWTTDGPAYRATHFHPADVGGVLLSVDSVEPGADYRNPRCMWEPAGPEWAAAIRTDAVVELGGGDLVGGELVGAELQSA